MSIRMNINVSCGLERSLDPWPKWQCATVRQLVCQWHTDLGTLIPSVKVSALKVSYFVPGWGRGHFVF